MGLQSASKNVMMQGVPDRRRRIGKGMISKINVLIFKCAVLESRGAELS